MSIHHVCCRAEIKKIFMWIRSSSEAMKVPGQTVRTHSMVCAFAGCKCLEEAFSFVEDQM